MRGILAALLVVALVACGKGGGDSGDGGNVSGTRQKYFVTFTVNGAGSVSSAPAGISCGTGSCSDNVFVGDYVITATAAAGSSIAGWSGACASAGSASTCTLSVNSNVTAGVAFAAPVTASASTSTQLFTVNSSVSGGVSASTVSSSSTPAGVPSNIACDGNNSGTCSAQFAVAGSSVTLTANPASTQVFSGWTGGTGGASACTGTANCVIAPQAAGTLSGVTATFAAAPVAAPTGTGAAVNVSVAGGGTVTSTSAAGGTNVNCTSAGGGTGVCVGLYASGDTPVFTATPASGYGFAGWFSNRASGGTNAIACSGTGTCSFTKSSSTQYLTAVFRPVASAPNPVVVYQDIRSGPTKGGEGGNGIYLSLFGKNFGSTGLGTGTVKVYLDNIEVANYRSTVLTPLPAIGPARARQDMQWITVQVGAAGNAANGSVLPITVVADGRASNTTLSFTVNPGNIYFVANAAPTDGSPAGNDSTGVAGDITKPYRTVQKSTLTNAGSGCADPNDSVSTAGVWGIVRPGDFIVMRGGTWTDTGKDSFFLRAQNKSGSTPTGAAGTGPITVLGYPGSDVFVNKNVTGAGGGFASADSARQSIGCGAWMAFSNLRVESAANEGAFNTEQGSSNPNGSYWRVVNNEMTAFGCNTVTTCKGAGVAGMSPGGYWVGNYVHDIYDLPGNSTDFENHGFYVEGSGPTEIAYNRITTIPGGNGIQTNDAVGGFSPSKVTIHHNLINGAGKHGINISSGSTDGIVVYDNVVLNIDMRGLSFNSSVLTGAKVFNNTFYNTDRLNQNTVSRPAVGNDATLSSGALTMRNNIFVPGTSSRYCQGGSVGFSAVAGTMSNNLCFGTTNGALSGTSNRSGDPKFASTSAGAEDLHASAGGDGVDFGVDVSSALGFVPDDFDVATSALTSTARPMGAGYDMGAYER